MTDEEWLEQAADRASADIKDQIVTGILNEVCEYFAFDEEEVR